MIVDKIGGGFPAASILYLFLREFYTKDEVKEHEI